MSPMKENLELANDIVGCIAQTDLWAGIQQGDPMIKDADDALDKKLEKLKACLPENEAEDMVEDIREAAMDLLSAFEYPAILYGMRVAQTIQEVTLDPTALSQHIMDRVAKRRGGDNPCGCSLAPSQPQNRQ